MSSENENRRHSHENGVFPQYNNGRLSQMTIYGNTFAYDYYVSEKESSKEIYNSIAQVIVDEVCLQQLANELYKIDRYEEEKRRKAIKKDVDKTKEMLNKDKDWCHRV